MPVFLLIALLFWGSSDGFAKPEFEVSLSPEKITTRQNTTLTLRADWPKAEADYSFAFPELALKNLTLERQGESQESFNQDGQEWTRKTFTFELKPIKKGTGQVSGFELPYLEPNPEPTSQKSGKFWIKEHSVKITPDRAPLLKLISLSGAGLLVLSVLGISLNQTRTKKKLAREAPPPATPSQQTLRKMNALLEAGQGKAPKDLLHELGTELKHFIVENYKLTDPQITESALIDILMQNEYDKEEARWIRQILARIHEAKFAGAPLNDYEFSRLRDEIFRYVESKRIVTTSQTN